LLKRRLKKRVTVNVRDIKKKDQTEGWSNKERGREGLLMLMNAMSRDEEETH